MPAAYATHSLDSRDGLNRGQSPLADGDCSHGEGIDLRSGSSDGTGSTDGFGKLHSPNDGSSRTLTSSDEGKVTWCSCILTTIGRWLVGSLADDLTRPEGWLLFMVVIVNFLSFCAGSIIAPVLPQHLARKMTEFGEEGSVSELHVSIAFVLYAGTSMMLSLVFGPLIPRLGVEVLYYSGLVIVALTNIALGLLDLLPIGTYQGYILAQCMIRIIEGIGAAAFNTSSHSIIMRVFSHHIDEAFASVEAAVAISFSLGPVLGSFLVGTFGWFWAFLAFGTIVLLTIPISVYVFRNYGSLRNVDLSGGHDALLAVKLVFSWKGFFVVLSMIATTTAYSFIEPTLEMFLEEIIQTSHSTLFYFAAASAFALTALTIAPFVAARSKMGTMILGTVILGIGFLVVGPIPYISREPNSHATMIGVILMGLGFALSYVPTLDFLVDTAVTNLGCFKGPTTYGPISGLWNFLNGFGETFGPVIAMFERSPDIRESTVMFATALFVCAMILMLIFFHVSIDRLLKNDALPPERTNFLLDKSSKPSIANYSNFGATSQGESSVGGFGNDLATSLSNEVFRSTELDNTIIGFLTPGRRKNRKRPKDGGALYQEI